MAFIAVFRALARSLVEVMAYFPGPVSDTDGHLVVNVQPFSIPFASIPFGRVRFAQFSKNIYKKFIIEATLSLLSQINNKLRF